ncbi:hypothetical protein LTR86_002721 [Recurvomyces mirabilis]|nr:hypothetical protein LTR86_002721 [Recurvomyces mirabilis]
MAEKGAYVDGIDLTPLHVQDAQRTIRKRGLQQSVSVQLGDYHNITAPTYPDEKYDGVYTMETFVHADDPQQVLANFYRILRPGGVLVLHEADFHWDSKEGSYEELLHKAGFKNVTIEDYTDNVLPLWRLFGVIGAVPYEIVKFFGLRHRFINLVAGVETYRHWGQGRYISVRAEKP